MSGVTISTLFGDNGIITAAKKAAEDTKTAEDSVGDALNDLADEMQDQINGTIKSAEEYLTDIRANLSTYRSKAQALGQTTDQNIGIGTDGKVANLDLWYYVKTDDGTGISLGNEEASDKIYGYKPENIVDGRIQGKVPQYIYITSEEKIYSIIKMNGTFGDVCGGIEELIYAPEIPPTVTDMTLAFYGCTELITAPIIPPGVTNMNETFSECTKLQGDLIINANPTSYSSCLRNAGKNATSKLYLTGSSTMLNTLLNTKGESTNIAIK